MLNQDKLRRALTVENEASINHADFEEWRQIVLEQNWGLDEGELLCVYLGYRVRERMERSHLTVVEVKS